MRDVRVFLILFVVSLLIFGIPMQMLNLNRDADSAIVGDSYGFWLVDAIFNQYLLSLGEFANLDNYRDSAQT